MMNWEIVAGTLTLDKATTHEVKTVALKHHLRQIRIIPKSHAEQR